MFIHMKGNTYNKNNTMSFYCTKYEKNNINILGATLDCNLTMEPPYQGFIQLLLLSYSIVQANPFIFR